MAEDVNQVAKASEIDKVDEVVWVVVEYNREYEFVDSIWTQSELALQRVKELNNELNKEGLHFYGAHCYGLRLNTKKVSNGPIGSV